MRCVEVEGPSAPRGRHPQRFSLLAALLGVALVAPAPLSGQADTPAPPAGDCVLEGTVLRQDGTPVAGATVRVRGVEGSVTTGPDGRYRIAGLVAGADRVVEISGAGIPTESRLVTLQSGRTAALDVELVTEGDEIVVTDKRLDASIAKVQLEKRYSSVVEDKIGAEELAKTPASNVADAVQQLPAVTIVGGRFAYVRGLGDRYSQTLLDGATLPSPEPDKRVVPLDLFPVGMIDSVSVAKTYSPELPGEFAGGSVQATTVGVPVAGFLEFSVSGKYTDGTTFRDFTTYEGGNYDWLGYDDGTRALPDEVPQQKVTGGVTGLTPLQLQDIGRSFSNIYEPYDITAPIDTKVSMSFGDSWEFGDLGRIGIIGAGQWSNEYQTVEDEEFNLIFVNSFDELTAFNEYKYDTSTFEAEIAAVLSATLEISPAQSITWRNLISRSSSDRVREQTGHDGQQDWEVEITQFKYVERMLFNSQLSGEHLLVGDMLMRWRAGTSVTERDQPDTRQNLYAEETAGSGVFVWQDSSASGTHDYYYLTEDVTDLGLDLAIPFNPFEIDDPSHDPLALEPGQYVKLGAAALRRDRDFDTRRFRYIPNTSGGGPLDENGLPIDLTLPPEVLFDPDNINPQGFVIEEVTRPTDNYEAEQSLDAAYASASFRVHPDVRLAGGARIESSSQEVRTFELFGNPPLETTAELDDTDVLPALNVTWEFVPDHQLRLGASRTVSRPEFRELAEFEYTDIEGGYAVRGNPNLERALLTNLDLRWEWYPTPEELVSISLFGKTIDDPIEQVNLPTGSSLITSFENADSAEIYGIELEGRKGLEFIDPGLEDFDLRGNFAWIESEVKASDDNPLAIQTNDERPLQGQPEWTANIGLFYTLLSRRLDAGILANAFGERISAVGSGGTPDEYEQPRAQLDFTISKGFEDGSKVRLAVENILNYEYLYEVGGETSRSYKTGWSIGISYSIDL